MQNGRRRPPAPPPPPPPRRPSRRLRRDASLASLSSEDFLQRTRYRCCCDRMHLRTASFLIALLDMIAMTAAFARGVHIGRSMQHNPMAISWFVASSLIFILGVFCTLSMICGVYREHHLCMLPMLVLKAFTVLVCIATTVSLIYMMIGHNQYLLDLLAEHVTKFDYDEARTALRLGGGGLVIGFSLMALIHVWFFRLLYRCYEFLKDKYFWQMCRHAVAADVSIINGQRRQENFKLGNGANCHKQSSLNGHGGGGGGGAASAGPSASVSNSTALTELEPAVPLLTPVSPRILVSGQPLRKAPSVKTDSSISDSCYTPIVNDIASDTARLWKAFEQTNV